MGVLKNDVGRPSNKTIAIRRILKGICLIIIIALSVGVGYYLKNAEINKKIDSNDKNTEKKVIEEENKTKELDIAKADDIMSSIFNNKTFFYYFDVETFNSDTFKTVYAIINTTPVKSSYTCKDLFGDDLESYDGNNSEFWTVKVNSENDSSDFGLLCQDNEKKDYYAYSDVEKTFKKMFSKGKVVKDFVSVGLVDNYAYSKSKNLYTWLSCECGDGGYEKVYGITGARQDENNVYIDFKIATFEPSEDENVFIGIDDSGKNVTMDAKDVLNNNINKLPGEYNIYTFTFEKVNNGYKFVEVK